MNKTAKSRTFLDTATTPQTTIVGHNVKGFDLPKMTKQASFFDGQRLTLERAMDLTVESLTLYGSGYKHWVCAFSGGKDSTATVTAVVNLIETGRVPRPKTLTVLYADTRQELPPLQLGAMRLLDAIRERGFAAHVVLPPMDDRFFVYLLGRGVPPPNNGTLRWCTSKIKIKPMQDKLLEIRQQVGEKFLMLTGVRLGESQARDARIALSCSRNNAECGQGWFQHTTPESVADTLAPLIHWRTCLVWDWLNFYAPEQGFNTSLVAEVYGQDEDGSEAEMGTRTGCIGCPLATKDTALDNLLKRPEWSYLKPLKRLRPLYEELREHRNRLRKFGERNKDGNLSGGPNRIGPLTMDARRHGLKTVLTIQDEINRNALNGYDRPFIDLIDSAERARILELIEANTWPNKWTGDEPNGAELLPDIFPDGSVQPVFSW